MITAYLEVNHLELPPPDPELPQREWDSSQETSDQSQVIRRNADHNGGLKVCSKSGTKEEVRDAESGSG